jgi:hypothetical protein
MPATTAFATATLQHLLQNLAIEDIGDAAGLLPSAVDGELYVSLHTASPTAGGNQGSSEVSYTGYARVPLERSAAGWAVAAGVGTNELEVAFERVAGLTGTITVTHLGIGTDASGAGNLLLFGALAESRVLANGNDPAFAPGTLQVTVT